jgi:hypothetical protein
MLAHPGDIAAVIAADDHIWTESFFDGGHFGVNEDLQFTKSERLPPNPKTGNLSIS